MVIDDSLSLSVGSPLLNYLHVTILLCPLEAVELENRIRAKEMISDTLILLHQLFFVNPLLILFVLPLNLFFRPFRRQLETRMVNES